MTYSYAAPAGISYSDIGLALTFIVPADDCNLNCSFCVIKQRKEAHQTTLSIDDYLYFIKDLIKQEQLAVIAVQGYEPLLPESWPYTRAIMELAGAYGLPRSFVTNGYLLEERAQDIVDVNPTGFSVSLDSADASTHDLMRGKEGAFAKTVHGLKTIAQDSEFAKRVTVGSVLMPGRREQLEKMPELLANIGVLQWSLSPLVRIGKDKMGGPTGAGRQIIDDVLYLGDIAKTFGVSVVLDDELRSIPDDVIDFNKLVVHQLRRPDGLIRLNANGACSIGTDILRQVGSHTQVWNPSTTTPSDFIDSIRRSEPDVTIVAA